VFVLFMASVSIANHGSVESTGDSPLRCVAGDELLTTEGILARLPIKRTVVNPDNAEREEMVGQGYVGSMQ
jgi:hypothetical protein